MSGGDSAGGWKVGQRCNACGYVCTEATSNQPDPCLGHLPGVSVACCGHGREGYIGWDLPGSTRVGADVVVRFRATSVQRGDTRTVIDPGRERNPYELFKAGRIRIEGGVKGIVHRLEEYDDDDLTGIYNALLLSLHIIEERIEESGDPT